MRSLVTDVLNLCVCSASVPVSVNLCFVGLRPGLLGIKAKGAKGSFATLG